MGIEGAGWATVAGSWAAALLALALMLRKKYRDRVQHRRRVEARARAVRPADEVRRPGRDAGVPRRARVPPVHAARRSGSATPPLGATTLTVRLNMIAFLPMMGLGQAICILVGQRLGENRPDLAEKSAYTGLKWSFGYMCLVALAYVAHPDAAGRAVRAGRPSEGRRSSPQIARSCRRCCCSWRSSRWRTR